MPITVDQASLGTNGPAGSVASIALTTTQAVAAGGTIIVECSWFSGSVTLDSVADTGSNVYTVDRQRRQGSDNLGVASAFCTAGMASGATITATLSAAAGDRMIAASSFLGVVSTSRVETAVDNNIDTSTTTSWTTGNITVALSGDLIYAASMNDGQGAGAPFNTAVAPSIKALEYEHSVASVKETAEYRIEASPGTYTVAGTWLNLGSVGVVVGVAYKSATSAAASDDPPIGVLGRGAGW